VPVYRIAVYPTTNHLKARLFFLEGAFSPTEAEQIARELLTDPVTETFVGGVTPIPEGASRIEVTFLPGVTDPVAENLVRSAHLLGITTLERAATGQMYTLSGDYSPQELRRLATEVYSNPVIQRYVINEPISPPFVPYQTKDDTVEIIPIRARDDSALLALSTERRLSLDLNEMRAIRDYYEEMERDPTDAELEMLAQTWSEHCVHKTFKANISYTGPAHGASADSPPVEQKINGLLKTYIRAATEKVNKEWVRSAFVDNAGIIQFDDIWDIAFKVETHNRPSALEPFGGANTGVGGVIRDVLGVSARPIANTDVLCFGMPDMPREKLPEGVLHPHRIREGVIAGIEDYGNKMGIPTVNGAIVYHEGYTSNPLVFCGCVGILPHGSHRSKAEAGDLIVVIGGKTGRDGLRGATFSSMEMDTTTATLSGGAVQIGHPIQEKQVQEVVLRARDEGLYRDYRLWRWRFVLRSWGDGRGTGRTSSACGSSA
jgi:phosphoribosylformylglycinamidine synthase subunit PurSL